MTGMKGMEAGTQGKSVAGKNTSEELTQKDRTQKDRTQKDQVQKDQVQKDLEEENQTEKYQNQKNLARAISPGFEVGNSTAGLRQWDLCEGSRRWKQSEGSYIMRLIGRGDLIFSALSLKVAIDSVQ